MTNTPKILVFAGSTRAESFNRKLAAAAAQAVQSAGGAPTLVELKEYPLPLFDQDLEAASGIPAPGVAFRTMVSDHDGLLIASPEYNSSITPLLKNTIDWISRPDGDVAQLAAFKGKTAAIMSASPSPLGGLRGLVALRMLLSNINVLVLPEQLTVAKAGEAFDQNGALKADDLQQRLSMIASRLVEVTSKLASE